jgi:hypothetical protein
MSWCGVASAEAIYKSVDAKGNVVYSDKPTANAQPVTLTPISIVSPPPATAVPVDATMPKKPVISASYKQLDIVSPQNDATIWDNNGNFSVQISMEPALVAGDTLQIMLDGKVVASSSSSTSFNITGIDRGTHIVQAQIINAQQAVVKTSQSITIFLHRTIASQQNRCPSGHCPVTPTQNGKGIISGKTQWPILSKQRQSTTARSAS